MAQKGKPAKSVLSENRWFARETHFASNHTDSKRRLQQLIVCAFEAPPDSGSEENEELEQLRARCRAAKSELRGTFLF